MNYKKIADDGMLNDWTEQKNVGFEKVSGNNERADRHASEAVWPIEGQNTSGPESKPAGDMKSYDRIAEWGGMPAMDQKMMGGEIADTGSDNFRG